MVSWYVLVILSAIFMGLGSIVRKHVLKKEHAMEIVSTEAVFRIVICLFFIPFIRMPQGFEWALILIMSAAWITTNYYRYRSYRHLPISIVSPMHNMSPVFLLIIAITLLGERPHTEQLIGIFMIIVGGYVLQLKGKDALSPIKAWAKNKYAMGLLLTLILMSLWGAMDKTALQTYGLPVLTWFFWVNVIGGVGSIFIQIHNHGTKEWVSDIKRDWPWLFVTSIFGVGNLLLYFNALILPGVLVSLAVPIRRLATLIETMLGGALFHEDHLLQKGLATIVMLAGILFIV